MKLIQAKKFKTPKTISHDVDRFGCAGFVSYGFVQLENQEIVHIKNPDFNWKLTKDKKQNWDHLVK